MTSTTVPVDSIVIGERDREELGNIDELAESIIAVGLLHPIVVTADMALVAGARRLTAVQQLGWADTPVTVVDLSTVADALRAEADENTCRKPLTPYEASRARERRAEVLAEDARKRKGGRPSKGKETSSNLDEVSQAERATRKAAAAGTGYSGSTLDKVDKIRDIAEKGVVKQGKTEVAAPAPVVEIAQKALEDVKQTGAAVDRASKEVDQALQRYLDDDPELERLQLRKNFLAAKRHVRDIMTLEAAKVALILEGDIEWTDMARLRHSLVQWFDQLESARPARGLRVVNGG